jgi:predicted RNase H-like HicB family nuclease
MISLVPLELSFGETIVANAAGALFTALFTALFVTYFASILVKKVESREANRRAQAEEERAKSLLAESKEHDNRRQRQEHEFQSRSSLRDAYSRLLVAQRRSRQASLDLSEKQGESREAALTKAKDAHDDFIDEYHRLALDADRPMWLELRGLRHILDDMLKYAKQDDSPTCISLTETARKARQNLEISLREQLGHPPLQERNPLPGDYDKKLKDEKTHSSTGNTVRNVHRMQ